MTTPHKVKHKKKNYKKLKLLTVDNFVQHHLYSSAYIITKFHTVMLTHLHGIHLDSIYFEPKSSAKNIK